MTSSDEDTLRIVDAGAIKSSKTSAKFKHLQHIEGFASNFTKDEVQEVNTKAEVEERTCQDRVTFKEAYRAKEQAAEVARGMFLGGAKRSQWTFASTSRF